MILCNISSKKAVPYEGPFKYHAIGRGGEGNPNAHVCLLWLGWGVKNNLMDGGPLFLGQSIDHLEGFRGSRPFSKLFLYLQGGES